MVIKPSQNILWRSLGWLVGSTKCVTLHLGPLLSLPLSFLPFDFGKVKQNQQNNNVVLQINLLYCTQLGSLIWGQIYFPSLATTGTTLSSKSRLWKAVTAGTPPVSWVGYVVFWAGPVTFLSLSPFFVSPPPLATRLCTLVQINTVDHQSEISCDFPHNIVHRKICPCIYVSLCFQP